MTKLYREISEIVGKDKKSINGITDELKKRGIHTHRLIVTGYLRALRDMGLLEENNSPPSKLYFRKPYEQLFFEHFNKACKDMDEKSTFLALITLINHHFHRKCTIGDLKSAGISSETVRKLVDQGYITENGGTYELEKRDVDLMDNVLKVTDRILKNILPYH
jgi:hypothetical protein